MTSKRSYFSIIFAVVVLAVLFVLAKQAPKGSVEDIMQVITGGDVGFSYPSEFGLAVTPAQLLVYSYIPPCDQDFEYCVYYATSTYQGTNFEAAGVRINSRLDLNSETACFAPPYDGLKTAIYHSQNYSTASIGPVGDAGAGHYATGIVYRLFMGGNCYEFQTRIGETQFANYPPGAIKQFTDQDRTNVQSLLREVIDSVTLIANDEKVVFPK